MQNIQIVNNNFVVFSEFGKMAIKERVITELKKKGIKAFQAEEDLHLARGYISKLDKSNPGADKLILLADYLGVTVDYLLDRHTPAYSPHIADFASRLIKLPPDYQKAVYEALDYQEYRYEKSKKSLELSREENDA